MNSIGWSFAILMLLGGCSTHSPIPYVKSKSPLKVTKTAASAAADSDRSNISYGSILPQELKVTLPTMGSLVGDLERFEQSIVPYVEQNGIDREYLYEVQKNFEKMYYAPWDYTVPPISVQEASWPIRAFREGYGSNLQPLSPTWFQEIEAKANFKDFGTLNQKAIALRWMNMRALPTEKPIYNDPSEPGEGYPFDMLQNSSINYNEPVFISHTSNDGAWSYIFTNSASGWVPSDGVAVMKDEMVETVRTSEKIFLFEDNIPLYDRFSRFAAYSRVGMVLPLQQEERNQYCALVYDSDGAFKSISIPKSVARVGVSKLNKNDLIRVGAQMLKNTYGWGGMNGERDCSSMIRDMYTPFGIWLPRNSTSQARKGEVVSFEGLSDDEKLGLIKTRGIPFETIVYLKGHVMLYIGTYEGNVMLMHNMWGIRTIDKSGKKGRRIVGKAVISTLDLGSELEEFDPENRFLTRARSMNVFTSTPVLLTKGNKLPKSKKSL